MITIDLNRLNPLERQIHEQMIRRSRTMPVIRIHQAAAFCQCSVSKISKFTKKLGFGSYRQYLDFLYGRDIDPPGVSDELNRIRSFVDTFDPSMTDELLSLIDCHETIALFGYGPSLLCAQYFEYRFRTCSGKTVMAVADEVTLDKMMDGSTLLLIITETGRFRSFGDIYAAARQRGGKVAIIAEEYNTELAGQCDRIFWLTRTTGPGGLAPYEKSRTLFFIFLEEVIQRLLQGRNTGTHECRNG